MRIGGRRRGFCPDHSVLGTWRWFHPNFRIADYPPKNAKIRSQYPQLVIQICADANVGYSSDLASFLAILSGVLRSPWGRVVLLTIRSSGMPFYNGSRCQP